jgi:hypothetical protein
MSGHGSSETHDHAHFAALTCPTTVTWTADIKKLFTQTDIDHMKAVTGGSLDLGTYSSVKIWARKIYSLVASGSMPPPGSGEQPWSAAWVTTFGCWIQKGCPQ